MECQPALYQPNQNNSTTIKWTEKGTTSLEMKLQNIQPEHIWIYTNQFKKRNNEG